MVLLALTGGGFAGAAAYACQFPFLMLMKAGAEAHDPPGLISIIGFLAVISLFLFAFAMPAFLAGTILVGGPLWLALERAGLRSPWIGALIVGLAAGLTGQTLTDQNFAFPMMDFAWLWIPGAVAGFTAWRLIYLWAITPPRPQSRARP